MEYLDSCESTERELLLVTGQISPLIRNLTLPMLRRDNRRRNQVNLKYQNNNARLRHARNFRLIHWEISMLCWRIARKPAYSQSLDGP